MNQASITEMSAEIKAGNITALSRAITFAESKKTEHQRFAQALIRELMPYTGKSKRIAISGVPGAGKSTFIETLGLYLIQKDLKVAVLAVDPSSSLSGGSILGDKTRMEELSKSDMAYIRPSATGGSLGGITARTYESVLLCEAAGFEIILVETVGVGQSETLVHFVTDFFLFLQVSGTGDDLQGIKRGIMEMADLIFLNKTDLYDPKIVQDTKMNMHRSLQFLPAKKSGWKRKVLKGSGYSNIGIDEVWQRTEEYFDLIIQNGYLEKIRLDQKLMRVNDYLEEIIINRLNQNKDLQSNITKSKAQLTSDEITPYQLSLQLLETHFPMKS